MPSASALSSSSRYELEEGEAQSAVVAAPSDKISYTSSTPPPTLASNNDAQDAPPLPDPLDVEAYKSTPRD